MTVFAQPQRQVLAATCLSYVIVILDTSIVNVALEPISTALGAGISGLQWVVNAYTLTFASLLLSGGALSDRFGAKNVYLGGLLLFGLASLACGLAPNMALLIGGRVLQGVGAALLVPSSLALINHGFPQAEGRAKAIALWAGCGGVAMAAGPLLGGLMIQSFGWRSLFLLNLPVTLLGAWLTLRVPPPPDVAHKRHADLLGQCLAAVALGSSVGVLIEVAQRGWHDNVIQVGVLVAVVAWGLFFITERRQRQPMLPLDLFRSARVCACIAVSMMSGLVFYGLFFLLSLYFQRTLSWSPLDAGLAFLPLSVLVAAGSFISGSLHQRIGALWLVGLCCTLYAAGFAGLFALAEATPYWRIALCFPAVGLAAGMITPVATAVMMGQAGAQRGGISGGVLNASRQTGSALGVAIFGGLLSAVQPQSEGIRLAIWVAIALSLAAGMLWCWALKANNAQLLGAD